MLFSYAKGISSGIFIRRLAVLIRIWHTCYVICSVFGRSSDKIPFLFSALRNDSDSAWGNNVEFLHAVTDFKRVLHDAPTPSSPAAGVDLKGGAHMK